MNHPYLFISGVVILSWLLPELLVAFNLKVPAMFNLFAAIAGGLISAAFVLP